VNLTRPLAIPVSSITYCITSSTVPCRTVRPYVDVWSVNRAPLCRDSEWSAAWDELKEETSSLRMMCYYIRLPTAANNAIALMYTLSQKPHSPEAKSKNIPLCGKIIKLGTLSGDPCKIIFRLWPKSEMASGGRHLEFQYGRHIWHTFACNFETKADRNVISVPTPHFRGRSSRIIGLNVW